MSERPSTSLYDPGVHSRCVQRIEQLTARHAPRWGVMTVGQMLAHCADVLEVANGAPLRNTPWYAKLLRGWIRKRVLDGRPYPRDTRTHPQYLQREDRDFQVQRDRLLAVLDRFAHADASIRAIAHPLLGPMSEDEKGWAMYKHLDHHLSQFGV